MDFKDFMEEQNNNSLVPVNSNALSKVSNSMTITNKIIRELSKIDLVEIWNSFDDFWKRVLYVNMLYQNELEFIDTYDSYRRYELKLNIYCWNDVDNLNDLSSDDIRKIFEIEIFLYNVIEDYGVNIIDITHLRFFKKIKNLNLDSNIFINITDISFLKKLEILSLSNCNINNIESISRINKLIELNLCYNKIIDITPLSGLKELFELYICNNKISDISSLSDLHRLTKLNLSHNKIIDFAPLSGLKELSNLDISNSEISDISTFPILPKLTKLNLSHNKIIDFAPLSGLKEL